MNVVLSGGGMKGAYQYGFFKRLYEIEPNFKINKVYAISVGSLNALPIVTKRMDLLEYHWDNPNGEMPFDTIVNEWRSVKSKGMIKRNIERARAFLKNGSIYHSLNVDPCLQILNSFNTLEKKTISSSVVIISFDTRNNKIVFNRCNNVKNTLDAIVSSTMMPGLFQINHDQHIIDIINIDFNEFCQRKTKSKWLCLDLQGSTKQTDNVFVYSPKIVNNPTLNVSSCILVSRCTIDDLIENGKEDADLFLNSFKL